MNNSKKFSVPAIAALVFLAGIFIYIGKLSNNNIQPPVNNGKPTLNNRDLAVKKIMDSSGEVKPMAKINGVTYFLADYNDTFYGGGPKENKPGWEFGGIIVFKTENDKPTIFWESEEAINVGSSVFFDIDNDGIPEIVWDGYFGATGTDRAFYVYKYNKEEFKLITPTEIVKTSSLTYKQTTLGGDSSLTYMKDIDGDKIQEIIVGYRDDSGIKNVQIYKFNGEVYELWKEEKINQ